MKGWIDREISRQTDVTGRQTHMPKDQQMDIGQSNK